MQRTRRITHSLIRNSLLKAGPTVKVRHKTALSWSQLHRASRLAHWSGFCYLPWDELPAAVEAENLSLVACGRTKFTSWYIADGVISHDDLLDRVRSPATPSPAPLPPPPVERFIFLRGVHWSAPDSDMMHMSRQLMDFWPTPFAEGPLPTPSPLVAHSGASSMASLLLPLLLPYLTHPSTPTPSPSSPATSPPAAPASASTPQPPPTATTSAPAPPTTIAHPTSVPPATSSAPGSRPPRISPTSQTASQQPQPPGSLPGPPPPSEGSPPPTRLTFAGHSLGGSLAKLLCVLTRLNTTWQPSALSCYTYGSPPVLAHREGGGGDRVVRTVGLEPSQMANFVLEHDPIPRAMLSADPYFSLVKDMSAVKALLQMRGWLFGEGAAFSSGRFLFENVGEVHLISWTPKGGTEVEGLHPQQVERRLQMEVNELQEQPRKSLQAFLDHHHGSYTQELDLAALLAARRDLRSSAASNSRSNSGSGSSNVSGS